MLIICEVANLSYQWQMSKSCSWGDFNVVKTKNCHCTISAGILIPVFLLLDYPILNSPLSIK